MLVFRASEGFYRRGALVDFPNVFLGVLKVVKLFFFCHSKLRKQPFLLTFSNSSPPPTHMLVCRENSCHTIKNWCNLKLFNTIQNSEILLNLIRKVKCLTDQYQLCFCFCTGNTKQLYLFLLWQHNWHPYRQLVSCYMCFVLSLHSDI